MIKNFLNRIGHKLARSRGNSLDFNEIYKSNAFGSSESHSGPGSTLEQTAELRKQLPYIFTKYSITSFLDIPCGDLNWIRNIDLGSIEYIGYDIVAPLIEKNSKRFGSRYTFRLGDIRTDPLPKMDLVFCRDCFVHLPFLDIFDSLATIKSSGSTWLMTTTFTECISNKELDEKAWRPLNMQNSPFNLPQPSFLINEKCTENGGMYPDKCMGLWRIAEL